MTQSARWLPGAVDRAAGPQRAFEPRRRLLGRGGFRIGLQQLDQQAIGALALALEICPVTGCRYLESRDLRLQCRDLSAQQGGGVAGLATARRPRFMAYFSKVNAHQRLAIVRQRARQAEPFGKGTGGLWRDFQAGAECGICQRLNGHRLFSWNEPGGNRLMTG
ncbi:hypothetical protein [Bradyrhizobium sp.]|uniref:hypothetical protein n=1 Tax=Bradyrhizobium sp. TaxID=376 RepID=UPI002C6AC683|nr:hypothetical protein [Bradyrhizobium sp.]HWX56997.1 hypothetical protein [Bradyrhizobium sp.]